jgi:hypothetical protein
MSFNLRSIKSVDSFEAPIKDQDGNPTGVVFILAGPTHPVRKAVNQAAQRKVLANHRRTGKFELPDPEETEKERVTNLTKFTLGWSGYTNDQGQVVPFSYAEASALYADPEMTWLTDQVDEALNNKALFTKSASAI